MTLEELLAVARERTGDPSQVDAVFDAEEPALLEEDDMVGLVDHFCLWAAVSLLRGNTDEAHRAFEEANAFAKHEEVDETLRARLRALSVALGLE